MDDFGFISDLCDILLNGSMDDFGAQQPNLLLLSLY